MTLLLSIPGCFCELMDIDGPERVKNIYIYELAYGRERASQSDAKELALSLIS